MNSGSIAKFRKVVWAHYRKEGRHDLPWRKTHDPYRILVSEVMLQQTQVERVKAYYQAWMKKFPTAGALAAAPLREVLTAWQGLGYNRRAKALHEAAKAVTKLRTFPKTVPELEALPGVGPYTARAIAAFSWNADVVLIETNLRTAVIHHFFPKHRSVSDKELLAVLMKALPKGKSREWYAALMDYGASLKRQGVRLNAKAKAYKKQAPLRGSNREARGALLRELSKGPATDARLTGLLGDDRREQVREQLGALVREGLVAKKGSRFVLPS